MNDASVRVADTLFLNNEDYLHIKKIEVFTGDDDYNETDLVEIESANNKLVVKKLLSEMVRPSPSRLRGEPGVRLFIEGESGRTFIFTLSHHKGNIVASAKVTEAANAII